MCTASDSVTPGVSHSLLRWESAEEGEHINSKETQMQKDQEVPKQVIEKLTRCPCQQDQPELVKRQSLTSNISPLFLTLTAREGAGGSSHTSPWSLLQLTFPLAVIACKPFPHCKQLWEVWQQPAQSDTTARTLLLLLKYWRSRTKKPIDSSGVKGCLSPEGAERWEWQGNSLHSSAQAGGTQKKPRFLMEKGTAALITFH